MKALRIHIGIVTLLCLAVFLSPGESYACDSGSTPIQQDSHSTKGVDESEQEGCCNEAISCEKDNQHQDNDRPCEDKSCSCTTSPVPTSGMYPLENFSTAINFTPARELRYFHHTAYISRGFHSIWLPPKIS